MATVAEAAVDEGPTVRSRLPAPPAAQAVPVLRTVAEYRDAARAAADAGRRVGVVPTMGALHAGHRALVARAAAECDVVVVTLFVNPTQFGEASDLDNYPRTLDADLEAAAAAGASFVFAPSVTEMYPDGLRTDPLPPPVARLASRLEGASRPGHFDGVATVVPRLLAPAGRCRAYFGEKDFQQLALVCRVVDDQRLPVEVVPVETVRDPDGLALSSRNVRLSPDERRAALALSRALRAAAAVARGTTAPATVEAAMGDVVRAEPLADLDYATVVDADTLEAVDRIDEAAAVRLLVAARVGPVRLIDNLDPRRSLPAELTGPRPPR